ncbi:MAG: DNA-binding protein [Limimaricola sp.]|uniref:helix-turn-helix domain-containing protein n=1 Tax=Limimaricola sp. TaxID=2211665 RepID=UPI001D7167E1|nr:helix-turn-helix domain-containing protein [Limimaricola sp.]MBI1415761.1 DNA-binding protein [Limimaricola sp.]
MTNSFLTRPEAAAYLTARGFPVAKATLQKYATVGGGPVYRRFGNRVLYLASDLDTWAQSKLTPALTASFEAPLGKAKLLPLRRGT